MRAIVCALSIAALLAVRGPVSGQALLQARLAAVPIEASGEAYYGVEMGFFKKAGLDVELTSLANGAAVAPAVASGTVDIGSSNFVSLVAARERGLPFVIIAPAGLYTPKAANTALVVPRNSPIKSARDLSGKTVAIDALKNIAYILLAAWLDANSGDLASIHFIEMPQPQIAAALTAGRVDAAVLAEPFLSQASSQTVILSHPGDVIGHDFLIGAYYCTEQYTKQHPDAVRRFAAAMAETARWANRHPALAAKLLEKYSKAQISAGTVHAPFLEHFDAAYAQPIIDAAAKYGVLQKPFPVSEMVGI